MAWVDRESGGAPDEVHEGRCAVKIHRDRAGELDAAEGIISDYVPVIPGNYDLTYAVRLKHVAGSRSRLGARLGDAVAVRLLFFDVEKKPADSTAPNPVGANPLDNSDKSYTFANYWSIDEFDWARVRARTYHYPFSEGDLPDGTRYVRLFLGLKGTGSMWMERQGVTGEHLSRGNAFLGCLLDSLESLQRQLPPGHALLEELKQYCDRAKIRFEQLSRESPSER